MLIIHIIIGLSVGGAELALSRLVLNSNGSTQKRPIKHMVVSLTSLGPVGDQLRLSGVEVIPLGMTSALGIPMAIYKLRSIFNKYSPDIVQTWMYHADLIGGIASYLFGPRKIIWGIRNTDIRTGTARSTYWVMKVCALLSRFLPYRTICVAHAALEQHVSYGYRRNSMRVIPNGFDVEKFKPSDFHREIVRSQLKIPKEGLIIGSVGRFNEYKDHITFIRAASILLKNNKNLYFLMLGSDINNQNERLMKHILASPLPEAFLLLDNVKEVERYFPAMDIFCLHSNSEGFPNVLGEAMAAGLPCAATDVGDVSKIMPLGTTIAPAQRPDLLATTIQSLIDIGESQRKDLGQKMRTQIIENYSLVKSISLIENLYLEAEHDRTPKTWHP